MKVLLQLSSPIFKPGLRRYKVVYEIKDNKLVKKKIKLDRPSVIEVTNPPSVRVGATSKRFRQSVYLALSLPDNVSFTRETLLDFVERYRSLLIRMFEEKYGVQPSAWYHIMIYRWSFKFKKWIHIATVTYNITGVILRYEYYRDRRFYPREMFKLKLPKFENIFKRLEREIRKDWIKEEIKKTKFGLKF